MSRSVPALSSAESSRSSSYALRTPPTAKINYVHRLGSPRKPNINAPGPSVSSAKDTRVIVVDEDDSGAELDIDIQSTGDGDEDGGSDGEGEGEGEVFTVGAIIAKSFYPGYGPDGTREHQYLVRWAGYGPADDTWEMESELLRNASAVVKAFNRTSAPFSIKDTRQENRQRHFLVRLAPPSDSAPHAEELWLTRAQMRLHGCLDVDRRIDAWLERGDQAFEPDRAKVRNGLGISSRASARLISQKSAQLSAGSKRSRDVFSPSSYTPSPNQKIKSKPSKPTPIFVSILETKHMKARAKSTKTTLHATISYRPNGMLSPEREGFFNRGQLVTMFGPETVNKILLEFRERLKVDQEAARQAQQDSEYEVERQRRIAENMAMMKQLGLGLR